MAKDKLTNLLYFDDFKEEVGRIIADQSRKYVVMSGNISNFKYINNIIYIPNVEISTLINVIESRK